MPKTTFTGPILAGPSKDSTQSPNQGTVVLEQQAYFVLAADIVVATDADRVAYNSFKGIPAYSWNALTAVTATFFVPQNTLMGTGIVLRDIGVDVTTAIVGPTALNLTAGITANGTDFLGTQNLMTGPVIRGAFTYSNANLNAMASVTGGSVFVQITPTVANVTAGRILVTLRYTQQ